MKNFEKLLRTDIEKSIGFKITDTSYAKAFLDLLQQNDIYDISLSTIRRFWGLIPKRKTTQTTLGKFASFLGYRSFLEYIKSKSRFEQLALDTRLQSIKFKDKLDPEDFAFLNELYLKSHSTNFITALFEHAVYFEKWEYLSQLLDTSNNSLLAAKDYTNEFVIEFAKQIMIYIKSIPESYFLQIVNQLLNIETFKSHILYVYIDVMNLNHRYGSLLKRIDSATVSQEEQLFLKLISNLTHILNNHEFEKVDEEQSVLNNMPSVLLGRFYGYQILWATLSNDSRAEALYWKGFLSQINGKLDIRDYFHEMFHHLLIAKKFEKLEFLLSNYYDELLEDYHIHSYLDIFLANCIDVILSYKSGEMRRAKLVFSQLDTDKISYGSYCDFYLIFYSIIGWHLTGKTKDKQLFLETYLRYSKASGFTYFDKKYLQEFFAGSL